MSHDIDLNDEQKLWVAKGALEQIKDAPVSKEEMEEIASDALRIIRYGSCGLPEVGAWAKNCWEALWKRGK